MALAREVGAAAASRELGIPAGSVRKWVRNGVGAEATEPQAPRRRGADLDELERLERSLRRAQESFDRLVKDGQHVQARACAVSVGILVDKVTLLRRERPRNPSRAETQVGARALTITDEDDEATVLSKRHARGLVLILRGVLGDLRLSGSPLAEERVRLWLGVGAGRPRPKPMTKDEEHQLALTLWSRWALDATGSGAASRPPGRTPDRATAMPAAHPVVEEPEDDEPAVEAEIVEDERPVAPVLPARRALPRAGASQFPRGSVQATIAGWGGSNG